MNATQQRALTAATDCEVRFDAHTRALFSTDASCYRIAPVAVAFPKSADDAASVIRAAAAENLPITFRGAGTGLAGAALGDGIVIDFSRYNRDIAAFDLERRTVRVDPGVVLDQLNAFLKPHGLCFGPDVATSSRATLGGMISNNSSGSHAPVYGTTGDHVESLDVVLADGQQSTIGRDEPGLSSLQQSIAVLIAQHEDEINVRLPPGLVKRWHGYGFDRWLRKSADLTKLVSGSEGTLAGITSAVLNVAPLPKKKTLGVLYFQSVMEAMAATVEILDLNPAAIEHMDNVLYDQTRGQLPFRTARGLLKLDEEPCVSILLVEFFDDVNDEKLNALMARKLGVRRDAFTAPLEMDKVWYVRRAGLSLLTGCPGHSKPVAAIEDTAVRPHQLPAYVEGLQRLMRPLGIEGSFYGHAASGLLHVRPVIDLHTAEGVAKYRKIADDVSQLVREFKGAISSEHGVGIARTRYLPDHLGPELMELTRRVKALFDPKNLLNPGKIIHDGRYSIETNLRLGEGSDLDLPFTPVLAYAAKDKSFAGNLEQCNGCGGCRKDGPTMCPTYVATGEEVMSTRGRANTIRAALDGRLENADWYAPELAEALANCLSCKACTLECPSNVNMALLKAELLHAHHKQHGASLRERVFSRVDKLNEIGSMFPVMANATLRMPLVRNLMERFLGIAARRPLPPYATQRFDRWFAHHAPAKPPTRGRVILWDDCFVRHNEPNIGRAAVAVLEAAGFEVVLPKNRVCCGRPAFSTGMLDTARDLAIRNLEVLDEGGSKTPILFLEPSCHSMLAEDYRELGLPGAEDLAARCLLFEDFMETLLAREPGALQFTPSPAPFAVHVHCHAKSLTDAAIPVRLLRRIPGANVTLLNTGCCGMAGSFGAAREKYDLSLRVAQPLLDQIDALDDGTRLVASGTSCRHQIEHLRQLTPLHVAEVLADRIG